MRFVTTRSMTATAVLCAVGAIVSAVMSAGAHTTVTAAKGSAEVSNASQLRSALAAAAPGETITLAPGTYTGDFVLARSGTVSAPIRITGPAAAVLDGGTTTSGVTLLLHDASWVWLSGFSVVEGQEGVVLDSSYHDTLSGLRVGQTGAQGVQFRAGSSWDVLQHSTVSGTGLRLAVEGQGVEVGTYSALAPGQVADPTVHDQIVSDTFSATAAQNIALGRGSRWTVIRADHLDGASTRASAAWITIAGSDTTVIGNVGQHATSSPSAVGAETVTSVSGFGADNLFQGNDWIFSPGQASYGVETDGGSGNVVYCDNLFNGAQRYSDVMCANPPPRSER